MEEVKFSISIKIKNMFIFQMKHAYHGAQGIIALLISIAALIIWIFTNDGNDDILNMMLIFTGLLFTVLFPFKTLYSSFKIITLSPVFRKPLDYTLCEDGINVSQEGESALLPWEAVTKVDEFSKQICIYSSPKNGYIIPIEQLGDKYDNVKSIIKSKVATDCVLKLQ